TFAEEYGRAAIDGGADIVIVQGSHAPMRGMEIYKGQPIFYDPGDIFRVGRREFQPQDFYERWGYTDGADASLATILDAYNARNRVFGWSDGPAPAFILSPATVYAHKPGFVLPVCEFDSELRLQSITLYPGTWFEDSRRIYSGFPKLARDDT